MSLSAGELVGLADEIRGLHGKLRQEGACLKAQEWLVYAALEIEGEAGKRAVRELREPVEPRATASTPLPVREMA